MNAIVKIAGFQYRVNKNLLLKVPKLDGKEGDIVRMPYVLTLSHGEETEVGKPYIDNAYVDVKIVGFGKYPKILVYKYKKRKKYRRMNGHRQDYTEIMVVEIGKGE
ncbi:50S ribosomal protein L21 [candidate division WOR-3 bacterium]|nr:50S ribosomal protein L21 [candidate division WOR-3 bacterium]